MAADINDAWASLRGRSTAKAQKDEPKRDILAEHFGEDWRTSFDPKPPADDIDPPTPVDPDDPYSVLGVEPDASWETIVEAHRRLARRNHPDQLFGRTEEEVAAAEQRMRDVNVAYSELRVRRGK